MHQLRTAMHHCLTMARHKGPQGKCPNVWSKFRCNFHIYNAPFLPLLLLCAVERCQPMNAAMTQLLQSASLLAPGRTIGATAERRSTKEDLHQPAMGRAAPNPDQVQVHHSVGRPWYESSTTRADMSLEAAESIRRAPCIEAAKARAARAVSPRMHAGHRSAADNPVGERTHRCAPAGRY
jgi:hypothetical protein